MIRMKAVILAAAVLLTACTSKQAIDEDARLYSEIAVTNPNFHPRAGDKIAWYAPIIWSSDAIAEDPQLRNFLTQLVEEQLVRKGYRIVADQKQADYIIGAAIVDGNNERSQQLTNFFRLFPSLGSSQSGLDESEALIGLVRQRDLEEVLQSGATVSLSLWRASLKAYVLGEKVSADERELRFRFFTERLLRSLPAAQAQ